MRLLEDLVEVLLPSPCAVCDEIPSHPLLAGVCLSCWASVEYLTGACCPRCGEPHASFEPADLAGRLCPSCQARRPPFDRAVSMGRYRGTLRSTLRLLKYGSRPELARPLGRRAWAFLRALPGGPPGADLVVPVPLPLLRRLRRGYNQAAEVARALARLAGLPCDDRLLRRRPGGRPQEGLGAAARARNVRGAFRVRAGRMLAGRVVLLVDDVWTTGATMRECARMLRRSGARGVVAFSLARVDLDSRSRQAL